MKIIKKGNGIQVENPRFPLECKCEICNSVLSVDEYDVRNDRGEYAECPVCGGRIDLQELSSHVFPRDFDYFGGEDTKPIEDERINKWINEGIRYFHKNTDSFCYMTGSGDTAVFILNFSGDEEYEVMVCKGYYNAYVPYTKEDYDVQDANGWNWKNKGVVNRID